MIPPEFLGIFAAFGLATAAGLNAWAPLFLVALSARFGLITLTAPYYVMTNNAVVVGLGVIALIEGLADKVPVLDHASHLIHFVIQPAAGAILFAAQGNLITDISPILAFFIGALTAGSVHTLRAGIRAPANVASAGCAAPVISFAEDGMAILLTASSLLSPLFIGVVFGVTLICLVWRWRSLRRRPPPTQTPPNP